MPYIVRSPDTIHKLKILAQDSQYDLACSCATRDDEHRKRSKKDTWVYPVALGGGRSTYLFKTLLSNHCVNNCRYCPLRATTDARRCALSPEELAKTFLSYYRARRVSGLFLTSGVTGNADTTMEQINRTALLLRRQQFRGYIHLKILPGASDAAIRQTLSLASAVSLNIETAGEQNFRQLSTTKDYVRDIMRPIEMISRLIKNSAPARRIKQTTQFVVGAATETDGEIIASCWNLYKQLGLSRVYFSAYQRGAGSPDLAGERSPLSNRDLLMREHRLYQADWLIRKYGFTLDEIALEPGGNLSLLVDPKERWADLHPGYFPVNINKDDAGRLLRVPGLGGITVERILALRRAGTTIRSLAQAGKETKVLKKAYRYITF
ncbi:MAG: radical SAM protein [Candidatus Omnitrophica bacterium]|nr:radical SAM protein [Candidatus Omnitrophota bacterium]